MEQRIYNFAYLKEIGNRTEAYDLGSLFVANADFVPLFCKLGPRCWH
jgi:hypothetical protein